ncbi:phage tail domain-containing protein [Paenibacillus sp. UNC499MF]|uniref:phage tail domain-containing protein n=1 Tax=Paenibacillus sp. UNC499MF TaxID=1502751 RepID=UPI00089F9505|nr:phage tail domain-containing protein [Paenibacillus sp. UNC499MF]SEF95225.1 hypothetical protein SAMN02799616_01558 [Paenibacillus sp. UNC499MF]
MATWLDVAGFTGYYESEELPIQLDGNGALTKLTWSADEPPGTSVTLYTNVSMNGGVSWSGWKAAVNGGSIPDIYTHSQLTDARVKFRFFLKTDDRAVSPVIREIGFLLEPVIEIENKGDLTIRPEIWITKDGSGDFSIINTSQHNREFKFTSLLDQEELYIHGDREQIETSIPLKYRYANFNDQYLELPYGINILKINGNGKLQFRYEFKRLQA